MAGVQERLAGGDLRSTGAADEIAHEAAHNSAIVPELVAGLRATDPVVRMRCADALEKATRAHPEYLAPHAPELLALLNPTQPKELLWHLLQMCPRVQWEPTALSDVFAAAEACLSNSSSIVKTSAMQALYELTCQAPERATAVQQLLAALAQTGTPAMRARGAKLVRQLGG